MSDEKNEMAVMVCDDDLAHVFNDLPTLSEPVAAVCGRVVKVIRTPDDDDEVCPHCGPAVLAWARSGKLPS